MYKSLAVIALALLAASCSTFSWRGRGGGVSPEQRELGIKDVEQLTSAYETEHFFSQVRRHWDGRANAIGRDLRKITATIDRHLFNYSWTDPEVNYESDTGSLEHLGRFAVDFAAR